MAASPETQHPATQPNVVDEKAMSMMEEHHDEPDISNVEEKQACQKDRPPVSIHP